MRAACCYIGLLGSAIARVPHSSVFMWLTTVSPAETDEPIEMPFGGLARARARWRHLTNTMDRQQLVIIDTFHFSASGSAVRLVCVCLCLDENS